MLLQRAVINERGFFWLKTMLLGGCFLSSGFATAFVFQVADFLDEFREDVTRGFSKIEGFSRDTLVKMAGENNYKPIHQVRKGDLVDCLDYHGRVQQRRVTLVKHWKIWKYYETEFLDEKERPFTIRTGPYQKFFSDGMHEWFYVSENSSGRIAFNHKIPCMEKFVTKRITMSYTKKRFYVFAIGVEEFHNYFVTRHKVLTHNISFYIPMLTWVFGEGLVMSLPFPLAVSVVGSVACAVLLHNAAKSFDLRAFQHLHIKLSPRMNDSHYSSFVQGICFNNLPGGSGENGSSTPESGSMAAAGGSGDPDPDGKPPKKDDCNCELYKEKEQNAAEYLKKAELDYHDRGLCKTDSCTPLSHEHQIDYKLGQIEVSITNNHKYGYCEKNIPVTSTPAESLKTVPNLPQSVQNPASAARDIGIFVSGSLSNLVLEDVYNAGKKICGVGCRDEK